MNNSTLSEDSKQKANEGLCKVVDMNDADNMNFTEIFYEQTQQKWYNYMKNDIKDPGKATNVRLSYFKNWFDKVARYTFEENSSGRFREYWNYLCGVTSSEKNNANAQTRPYNLTQDECDSVTTILTKKTETKKLENSKSSVNACMPKYAYNCIQNSDNYNYDTNACSSQTNSSSYKSCTSCLKKCATYPTDAKEGCEKNCVGGDEEYQKYLDLQSEYDTKIKNAANEAVGAALTVYNLRVANAPTLNLSFTGNYTVDCDDFEVLKIIYNAVIIIAPVLVILFGSIDYTKAVLASDAEKMKKAQKKFVPRLIAAVLLILVPIIVRLILSFADLSDSALSCIVK